MASDVVNQIVELWLLWFFGELLILARVYFRTRLVGVSGYHLDDWLILCVAGMWMAAPVIGTVFVSVCGGHHTSELTHEQREQMPADEYAFWTYGSQIFLFGLSGYFLIIWMSKFCQLCLYQRIVEGLWTAKFINPVKGLLVVSFLAIALTMTLTCRPFNKLWQVWPDPGGYCVPQNLVVFVTILAFNLLTDICIILIPAPIIIGINRPLCQRLWLYFLFSLGFFCMFAAILRFVLIFQLNQSGISAMWSMREDFVAIFVVQAPMVTPLFRRKFWTEHKTYGKASKPSQKNSRGPSRLTFGGSANDGSANLSSARLHGDDYAMSRLNGSKNTRDPYSVTRIVASESEEDIVRKITAQESSHTAAASACSGHGSTASSGSVGEDNFGNIWEQNGKTPDTVVVRKETNVRYD